MTIHGVVHMIAKNKRTFACLRVHAEHFLSKGAREARVSVSEGHDGTWIDIESHRQLTLITADGSRHYFSRATKG